MIDIILYKNKQAAIHPACWEIPQFKKIAEREEGRKIFTYIYHRLYHGSPYAKYGPRRKEKVNEEIMGDKDYKPDKETIEAMKLYAKLIETPSSGLLNGAIMAASRLKDYFNEVQFSGKTKSTQVKNLISSLGQLDKVVSGLQKLEEQVRKEEQSGESIRGGVKLTKYNVGDQGS